ncbi:hypothetical protein CIHG_03872 [Coccidioides immitis H538.4]|uniref:Uncharacterized protein n=3 Tax=Coccidioides immitis TaxID=5501 RepID=A0A0J8QS46_COCIT|nr:hypothetical protein CIRG_03620 [Coccidioides immitis RMSCC 2394]KMU74905.1 hypothetical protein CISG_00834 [Coccidioides immitis RMSCC 3703]KMU86085.1 hypothetical protein CIHG_03872 [Coccidioides immitis H538.4]
MKDGEQKWMKCRGRGFPIGWIFNFSAVYWLIAGNTKMHRHGQPPPQSRAKPVADVGGEVSSPIESQALRSFGRARVSIFQTPAPFEKRLLPLRMWIFGL